LRFYMCNGMSLVLQWHSRVEATALKGRSRSSPRGTQGLRLRDVLPRSSQRSNYPQRARVQAPTARHGRLRPRARAVCILRPAVFIARCLCFCVEVIGRLPTSHRRELDARDRARAVGCAMVPHVRGRRRLRRHLRHRRQRQHPPQ
jgi:hypothetical protein